MKRNKVLIVLVSFATLLVLVIMLFSKSTDFSEDVENVSNGVGDKQSYSQKEFPVSIFKSDKKDDLSEEVCLSPEEYGRKDYPSLSLPFDPDDYSTKYWGVVPFCAKLRNGQIHGALDYELKSNSKIYAAAGGTVLQTEVGKQEGSGEVIVIQGSGFRLDYSGLHNLQVKEGDVVKKGDYKQ